MFEFVKGKEIDLVLPGTVRISYATNMEVAMTKLTQASCTTTRVVSNQFSDTP